MLKAIGKEIWAVEYDFHAMGIHFPGRMTVIRLGDGTLWLCSVVPIDDALAAALEALGPVAHIVAPNKFHHVHLPQVVARYPSAQVWGAKGLAQKRKDLEFKDLEESAPDAWKSDLQQVALAAVPTFNEVVFFHAQSGTLITTDLFMNVHQTSNLFSRFVYWIEGCYRNAAVPRLIRFLVKDKARMRDDLTSIAQWPIQRLLMAHGDIVESDAARIVRQSFVPFGAVSALPSGH
ncbi:MAG: DUF4336 domain-containing protein [Myxococcota bacterium]